MSIYLFFFNFLKLYIKTKQKFGYIYVFIIKNPFKIKQFLLAYIMQLVETAKP